MQDPGAGLEDGLEAGPVQAKGHVHVFEIGLERIGERADADQGVPAIEGAGAACAEYGPGSMGRGSRRLTSMSFGRHAADEIPVAGAIDAVSPWPAEDQRRYSAHSWVVEACQGGIGPPGHDFGVVVEQFDNSARRRRDARIDGPAKTESTLQLQYSHSGELTSRMGDDAIAGSIVDDDNLGVRRGVPLETAQAQRKEIDSHAAGDDNGKLHLGIL
jgi:hypothetical protein